MRDDSTWHIEPADYDCNREGGIEDEGCFATIPVSELEAAIEKAKVKYGTSI